MIAFGVAMIFTLIGTFTIKGDLVIHWSGEGISNNSAGKWILWTLLLMAFLSIFTHGTLSKKRPGRNTLSIEMAGALSSGLVSMWSIVCWRIVHYCFNMRSCNEIIWLLLYVCRKHYFILYNCNNYFISTQFACQCAAKSITCTGKDKQTICCHYVSFVLALFGKSEVSDFNDKWKS